MEQTQRPVHGTIPGEQVKRLLELGWWLEVNGKGIYGSRCSRRLSEHREDRTQVYYTRKGQDLYFYIDGLKEGCNVVSLPGLREKAAALDPALELEQEVSEDGLRLTVKNYRPEMYLLGFEAAGQE